MESTLTKEDSSPKVALSRDLRPTGKIPEDELNLLYVAVTRAKTTLIITKNIRRILSLAGVRPPVGPGCPQTRLGNSHLRLRAAKY